ncbi:COMM domain containing protein 9 [Dissostichus eleginoides]|uniref:COMM domain containing protein 9 n=1 Tax=Dissostichus eleginoides TaxID=100907 RepID=A0AAD9B303_DISEL|nr:COMM domain containing protein 9 [Dissostichus eleginoides]
MAASVSSEHFDSLQLLLKAPSKDAVRDVCVQSHRGGGRRLTETTAETLNPLSVPRLLPQQPEEPDHQGPAGEQLKDLDWTVSMVTGSDSLSRMSVPTCLVQLQMEDPCQAVSTTTVELSRASLDTMLDGLGRIRDQLSVVAGK